MLRVVVTMGLWERERKKALKLQEERTSNQLRQKTGCLYLISCPEK